MMDRFRANTVHLILLCQIAPPRPGMNARATLQPKSRVNPAPGGAALTSEPASAGFSFPKEPGDFGPGGGGAPNLTKEELARAGPAPPQPGGRQERPGRCFLS